MKTIFLPLLICVLACDQTKPQSDQNIPTDSTLFHLQVGLSSIKDRRLEEASGMDMSYKQPGYFWTHNDSGDTARIFLINRDGEIKATIFLEGLVNRDWEEIVSVEMDGKSWLYICEIGDNRAIYPSLMIHRIEEPMTGEDTIMIVPFESIETMEFNYPNGARDAESMFYDFNTGELVLVTKREEHCFVFSFPFKPGQSHLLPEPIGILPSRNFVAADMRPNGEIVLKNYDEIFYWPADNEPAGQRMVKGFYKKIPYKPEPQGESICWDADGNIYTLSEYNKYAKQQVFFFERK